MNENVVVFGGAGFVGTRLLARLVRDGESPISFDIRNPNNPVAGVDYRIADVRNLDGINLPDNTSRIYNLAAVHTTPGHPDHEYYDVNVNGALEVARVATASGVSEIIFTSSISVYGPDELERTEESPLSPVSAYGRSKKIAERIHVDWQSSGHNRKLIVVRPAVVFGPGEGGNFSRMASLLKKGIFIYPGRKDTIKACIYVEDLLDAIEFARHQGDSLITFNGAYSEKYTIENIVSCFKAEHFESAREITVPLGLMLACANFLRLLDVLKLGIHPDRVLKLVRSTNIAPQWLKQNGWAFRGGVKEGLRSWSRETNGEFL